MYTIVKIFLEILDIIITYKFLQCYFYKKNNMTPKGEVITLGLIIATDILLKNILQNTVTNLIVSTIVIYTIVFIFFDERIHLKLFIGTMFFFFTIILDSIIGISINYILNINMDYNVELFLCIANIIYILIFFIIFEQVQHNHKKNLNSNDYKLCLKLFFIPFISILFIVIFFYLEIKQDFFNYIQCYLIIIMLIIINTVHYIIYEHNEKLFQENYNNLLITQEFEYREEYYKNLEKHQDEIRIIKHDLKNQLIGLATYNSKEAKKEIEILITDLVKKDELNFTCNVGINSLLFVKYTEATNKNINCNFNVKLPKHILMKELDLISILGNILDNAIESCNYCKISRYINFDLLYYNKFIAINIKNSTDGNVNNLKTRKKNQYEHGLGLKSVTYIVNKYNGNLKYTIKDNFFELQLNLWDYSI